MSYLVFARKCRPLTFNDVIGQEHITTTLKKAIAKDRVAHAYIFSGTRGVGKTTTARILSRALNCEQGPTPDPCGSCESCKNIIKGSSFDVLEIDGASNNGVDNIRELRENVGYSSMTGRYRIFVIDEVHMLTKGAFNALLKTLEEPPPKVIFIFATTEPQKIPDTIHSRCQKYDFRRISEKPIVEQLEKICTNENIEFEKSGLYLIAHRADGSMRDALSLLDQVFSFSTEGIRENEVRSVLGLVATETYGQIMTAIKEESPKPVLTIIDEVLNQGYDLLEFLVGFQEYIRTLLFVKIPGMIQRSGFALAEDELKGLQNSCSTFSEGDLLRMSEILKKAELDLKWSSFPRFLVETSLLKLVYLDKSVTIEQVIQSIQNVPISEEISQSTIKKKSEINLINHKDTTVISIPSIPPQTVEDSFKLAPEVRKDADIQSQWPSFLEVVRKERPNLGSFLEMAQIAAIHEDSIDLRFPKHFKFQFSEVIKKNNRNLILEKLASFFSKSLDLHITLEKYSPLEKKLTEKKTIKNGHLYPSLADDMVNEPILKNIIEVFDGEMI